MCFPCSQGCRQGRNLLLPQLSQPGHGAIHPQLPARPELSLAKSLRRIKPSNPIPLIYSDSPDHGRGYTVWKYCCGWINKISEFLNFFSLARPLGVLDWVYSHHLPVFLLFSVYQLVYQTQQPCPTDLQWHSRPWSWLHSLEMFMWVNKQNKWTIFLFFS